MMKLKGNGHSAFCGVLTDLERRFTKKMPSPGPDLLFNDERKRIFLFLMFTDAYEQFGQKLEEGEIMVVEGVASTGWRDQNDSQSCITSRRSIDHSGRGSHMALDLNRMKPPFLEEILLWETKV